MTIFWLGTKAPGEKSAVNPLRAHEWIPGASCGNVRIGASRPRGRLRPPGAQRIATRNHLRSRGNERQNIILIAALGLAAAAPADASDLLVTQYKYDPSGAPYGMAMEKGFFTAHGLDITGIISGAGGGSSVRNAIASDLGYGDVTAAPVIAAAEQGQDVKIISITARSLADLVMVVMPNSPLKTPADLKGKKFGISNPKSLGEMTAVLVFEQAGLKQGRRADDGARELGGALTALENGVVDVTSIPIILFRTRGGRANTAYSSVKDLPLIPSQLGMATGKAMKEWPDKLRAIELARRDGRNSSTSTRTKPSDTQQALCSPAAERSGNHGQGSGRGEILERGSDRDAPS